MKHDIVIFQNTGVRARKLPNEIYSLFSIYIPFFLCTSDGPEREEKSAWNIAVKNADGIGRRSQLIDLLSKEIAVRYLDQRKPIEVKEWLVGKYCIFIKTTTVIVVSSILIFS